MSPAAVVADIEIATDRARGAGGFRPGSPQEGGGDERHWARESGGVSRVDGVRLGMLIFLGAETMLFAGFVAAYLVFRLGAPAWPPPGQPRLPIEVTGANTAVLLSSGYTLWRALKAARRGSYAALAGNLAFTALLGLTFIGVQGYEWMRLLRFGLTASSGIYGAVFYTLIGAHALHVAGALAWILIFLFGKCLRMSAVPEGGSLPALAMYWYFVVGLWPLLYTLVYLV